MITLTITTRSHRVLNNKEWEHSGLAEEAGPVNQDGPVLLDIVRSEPETCSARGKLSVQCFGVIKQLLPVKLI